MKPHRLAVTALFLALVGVAGAPAQTAAVGSVTASGDADGLGSLTLRTGALIRNESPYR